MIQELSPGKFIVRWPIATVRRPNGHFLTGRTATVEPLGVVLSRGEAVKVGSREECERQEES